MFRTIRVKSTFVLLIVVLFALTLGVMDALWVEAAASHQDVAPLIRLHVIPNSDLPADQDIKLRVRDDVLVALSATSLLGESLSLGEALQAIEASLPHLETVAKQRLALEGIEQNVEIRFGMYEYDERAYLGFTIPAGDYISVEVILGAGAGHNFWCIIFPTMCFVPEEVQVLSEERARGNVAEAAVPSALDQKAGSKTIEFRWRLWDRVQTALQEKPEDAQVDLEPLRISARLTEDEKAHKEH